MCNGCFFKYTLLLWFMLVGLCKILNLMVVFLFHLFGLNCIIGLCLGSIHILVHNGWTFIIKVENRKNQLRLSLSESTRSRIKLTERELKLALGRGAAMAQVCWSMYRVTHKEWDFRDDCTEFVPFSYVPDSLRSDCKFVSIFSKSLYGRLPNDRNHLIEIQYLFKTLSTLCTYAVSDIC